MTAKRFVLGIVLCSMTFLLAACDNGISTGPTPTTFPTAMPETPTALATPIALSTPTAPAQTTTGATAPAPTTASRPTPPVAGWNSKVTYEKSGGVAGIKQTLLVGPAGQARLIEGSKNSGPVPLTADRLSGIKKKLDAANFFDLKDHYGNGNVADDFIYTISLSQGGKTRKIVVEEQGGKGVTPQVLLDFMAELDSLKTEIEAGPQATAIATTAPTMGTTETATVTGGTETTTIPQSTPQTGAWNSTLNYERTGGFAGVKRTLTVSLEGQARLIEGNTDTGSVGLSPDKLAEIQGKFDAAHFFDLKDSYGIAAADGYVVKITLTRAGRTKSVTVSEGNNDDVSAELGNLMIELNNLAESMKGNGTPTAAP